MTKTLRTTASTAGVAVALTGILLIALCAQARAEGGNSIASAPVVTYGKQLFGNTASGQDLEYCYRQYWQLPVLAGDKLTVDWESQASPGTQLKLMPIGTTDFTYFQTEPSFEQGLTTNHEAQAQYVEPVSGNQPMAFKVCEIESPPGPYDFTASIQHGLAAALTPVTSIATNSVVTGVANLADGSPVPDGTVFDLVVTWHLGQEVKSAVFAAPTAASALSFQLALPAEAAGKKAHMSITRPEDTTYQAANSAALSVTIEGEASPAPVPVHHHHRHHHHHHRRHHHHHRR